MTIPTRAVETYQCPGCTNGPDPATCPQYKPSDTGCTAHVPGTIMFPAGIIALGLPKGFDRFGPLPEKVKARVLINESYEALIRLYPNLASKFSLPIWCHLDEHGNTITRWYSPRVNRGWSEVILGDCTKELIERGCRQLTTDDINGMD